MHYAIISFGSRGDVQPYIALSLGLMERGHHVTLLANENFREFAEGYAVDFFPLHGDMERLAHSPKALALLRSGNIVSFLRHMQRICRESQTKVNVDIMMGCGGADILVASPLTFIWAYSIAEKLGKPWAIVQLSLPAIPTKDFPFAGLAFFDFPLFNLFTHRLIRHIYWSLNKKGIGAHRAALQLPALKKSILKEIADKKILNLFAFSPALIARPKDWGAHIDITGFLAVPEKRGTAQPGAVPEKLNRWLETGEPPIYIGFGSMPIPDPILFSKVMAEMIERTSQRFVFCRGWSPLPDMPEHHRLFIVREASHAWLFPQCRAAIIHGGIGTIAAALRARLPTVILSIFADQPMWGKIISEKNLGVCMPFRKMSTQKLLDAIEIAGSASVKKNLMAISAKIEREDGLSTAIDKLERHFGKG